MDIKLKPFKLFPGWKLPTKEELILLTPKEILKEEISIPKVDEELIKVKEAESLEKQKLWEEARVKIIK